MNIWSSKYCFCMYGHENEMYNVGLNLREVEGL